MSRHGRSSFVMNRTWIFASASRIQMSWKPVASPTRAMIPTVANP